MYTILLILMVPIAIAFFLIFFKRKEWITKIPKMPKLSLTATIQDKQSWKDTWQGTVLYLFLIFGTTSIVFAHFVAYLLSLEISAVIALICLGVGVLSKDNKKLQAYTKFHLLALLAILMIAGATGKMAYLSGINPDPEARSVINPPTATTETHKPQWITLPDGSLTVVDLRPGEAIIKILNLPPGETSIWIKVPSDNGQWNLRFNHNKDIYYQVEGKDPVLVKKDGLSLFPFIDGDYRARFISLSQMTEVQVSIVRLS